MNTQVIAELVYSEVFGHLDDKRFKAAKVGEIADWLSDDDGGIGAAIAALAAEWREYDSVCEQRTGCPGCGNVDQDTLEWQDDDSLTCCRCQRNYRPE